MLPAPGYSLTYPLTRIFNKNYELDEFDEGKLESSLSFRFKEFSLIEFLVAEESQRHVFRRVSLVALKSQRSTTPPHDKARLSYVSPALCTPVRLIFLHIPRFCTFVPS